MKSRRSDKRRKAIVDVATEVFHEFGFARASMAEISARLGGSKGTLYGYFNSKDELFTAVMRNQVEYHAQRMVSFLRYEDDIFHMFVNFGAAYLDLLTSDYALSTMRIVISEGNNSTLSAMLYAEGPENAWTEVSDIIGDLTRQGRLQAKDPRVAAMQLKGLLEAGIIEPLLFGAEPLFKAHDAVVQAVETFLKAYGVWSGSVRADVPGTAPDSPPAKPGSPAKPPATATKRRMPKADIS